MTTPRPDSRLGTDLGPYRIEAVLGRGGMGVVYLASQRELGRKVALKLLPDELAQDADFRARFERESRLAAAIDHPNVIPLYEAGEIEGTLFLAMRYVEGTDLATRLREGPLATATALEILAQVAGALDAAHEKGLVHRDVKPGNVLLDRAAGAERPHAYLVDFGLTKQAGSETGLTRAGAFLGTPAYMAPEQVDGLEVDGRADQYALGAMAFEMLTGRVPFVREKEVAVALAHLKDPVPSAVALRPELPPAVDTVLGKVMAKDREARYPTCGAFADDLRAALGGGAVAARPIVATSARRRTPLLVGAVVGLGLLAVAGLVLASNLGGSASPSPSPSAPVAVASASPAEPKATSTAFPDERESGLLALLPEAWGTDCRRGSYEATDVSFTGDADPHRPTGSVDCTPPSGSGADAVSVRLFDGIEGQGDAELSTVLTNFGGGLAPADGGGSPLPSVGCASSWISSGRWTVADRDAGAILCYRGSERGRVAKDENGQWVERGAAWLYWSYADPPIFAWAMREDGDSAALYDWWSQSARFIAP